MKTVGVSFIKTALALGYVTEDEAREAAIESIKTGIQIGQVLLNRDLIDPNKLIDILRTNQQIQQLEQTK